MGGGGCCIGNCCVGRAIGDFISNLFGSSKGSESGGSTESYESDKADLLATVKVQSALTEFRADTDEKSRKLEKSILAESRQYLDEFIKDLRTYNKISYGHSSLNINIENIMRENRKTEDEINGFIVKRVSKRISLDDTECLEILKMEPGNAKTKKLDQFYHKVLAEAINELSDMLRNVLEQQTNTVEERIHQRLDSIIEICETRSANFDTIKKVKNKDESKIEQEQIRLSHIVALSEYGLTLLN